MRHHPIPGAVSHLTRTLTITTATATATATVIALMGAYSPGASAGRDTLDILLETLAS